jgi:phenylalanyl-tRNA synthetase alpha subunit
MKLNKHWIALQFDKFLTAPRGRSDRQLVRNHLTPSTKRKCSKSQQRFPEKICQLDKVYSIHKGSRSRANQHWSVECVAAKQ